MRKKGKSHIWIRTTVRQAVGLQESLQDHSATTYCIYFLEQFTMAGFSTVCHVLIYTTIFAFVYQLPHICPALRGQCKTLKHGTFARL